MSRNISREKRENLLAKIRELRVFLEGANATPTMKAYLSELESELKRQKFGLVFEEHKEEIDEILESHTPVLTEDKSLFIDNGGPMNFIIEGDNLAALTLLEKTHKGKIDVIYIDPPYNTGNKDFVYDDSFVGPADLFRHSKWLSFMRKRLEIARNIITDNGIIFISIDDKEQSGLKLLCDSIFGEENFISNIVWKSKSGGANDSGQIVNDHEYILTFSKRAEKVSINHDSVATPTTLYNFHDEYGKYALERLDKQNLRYSDSLNFEITGPDGRVYKLEHKNTNRPNATWRWSKATINERYSELVFKNGHVYTKNYEKATGQKPRSLLIDERFGRTRTGSTDLRRIVDTSAFSYPKPLNLVTYLLAIGTRTYSTILDFFAGSGTTGHAVMELNKQDGGNRKFILCTNNENGICRDVTYERIKTVITGKRKDGTTYGEPLPASLKYQRIDFIPTSEQTYYDYADELLLHIRELVELENAINFEGNNDLAILLTEDEVEQFFASEDKFNSVKTIYLGHDIALTLKQQQQVADNNVTLNVIPEYYYKEQQI